MGLGLEQEEISFLNCGRCDGQHWGLKRRTEFIQPTSYCLSIGYVLGNVLGTDVIEDKTNQSPSSAYFLVGELEGEGAGVDNKYSLFGGCKSMEKKQSRGFMDVCGCWGWEWRGEAGWLESVAVLYGCFILIIKL